MSEVKRFNVEIWPHEAYIDECSDGEYVKFEDYAELKAQGDALAADREKFAVQCAAAKIAVQYAQAAGFECTLNTPAVDAYLNSVRVQGINLVKEKTAQAKERLSQLADYEDYEPYLLGLDDACDQVIKEILDGTLPEKFAAQLRTGEPS